MSRKEHINSILDDYLAQRNKPKFSLKSYINDKKRRRELEEENSIIEEGEESISRKDNKAETEMPEEPEFLNLDEVKLDLKEQPKGIINRLRQRILSRRKEKAEEAQEAEDVPRLTQEDFSSFSFEQDEAEEEQGFFSRLFLRKKKEEINQQGDADGPVPAIEHPLIMEDMIKLGKATSQIFKSLPPDQIRNIKNMPEFEEYKEILKKHEIIR